MSGDWQTWAALLVVLIAAVYLIRTQFVKKKPGCGGGAMCPTDDFKKRLHTGRLKH
jgi:hypothetical protein